MEYEYQIHNGNYVLCRDGELIGKPLKEVALVMVIDYEDMANNMILKHGDPELTAKDYATRQAKYNVPGLEFAFNGLMYIQGRFNVKSLNDIIQRSGRFLHPFLDEHGIPHHRIDQKLPSESPKRERPDVIEGELEQPEKNVKSTGMFL